MCLGGEMSIEEERVNVVDEVDEHSLELLMCESAMNDSARSDNARKRQG